ncbi:kinase-like protein, partial [Ramicandelaber brevisporus]
MSARNKATAANGTATAVAELPDKHKAGQLSGWHLDVGRYTFIRTLGVGTYGEVYMARDNRRSNISGQDFTVAIKCFPPFTVTPRTSRLNMEVGLQLRLPPHPNVVHIHRVLYVNNVIFIVMEHIDGTDMYHRIINHRSFTRMRWPEHNLTVRNVFTQLVDAVAHCHRHGVYHRDLKPENIILIENDIDRSQEEGVFTAKIVDFGLATDKAWADEIGCGSKFYISPDGNGGLGWRASGASLGFLGRVTNYATGPNDVWALGVILVNLASGRNPWNQAIPTDPLFAMHLKNPDFLSGMLPITRTFAAILRAIFTIDPVERVSLRRLRTMVMDCEEF